MPPSRRPQTVEPMRRPWFRRDRPPPIIATLVALVWLVAAVAVPSDPAGWHLYGLLSIPMELAVAVAAFVLVPPLARSGLVRWILALAVTALLVLKVWDALIHLSLGRTVDAYVDGNTLGASWDLAVEAADRSGGKFRSVTDDQILAAQRDLAAREGVFVEPASAAGVAGLLLEAREGVRYAGEQIVVTVTGHGLKDIDTALSTFTDLVDTVCDADVDAAAAAAGLA